MTYTYMLLVERVFICLQVRVRRTLRNINLGHSNRSHNGPQGAPIVFSGNVLKT